MESDPIEWGFKVPASRVDLDEIYVQLGALTAVEAFLYLHALREKAPTVYRRLGAWAKAKGVLSYWNFEEHTENG